MPSYRVTMIVGTLELGVRPEEVLPTLSGAIADFTTVESSDLAVVAGSPRVTVRFTADTDEAAFLIAEQGIDGTRVSVEPIAWQVTRMVHGRWEPLA
ncbi:hypothetical protein VD659_13955 [Herbiconiux sp. 11R-BC]|uniref:hypothetical protein n=1 Tax=Herbiconiux sp. 11R-BC TaxID=3111637 RepID=UPI003BFBDA82